jgi:hypothetical protein
MLNLSKDEFCKFLVLAKQNTFAIDAPKSKSKCILSKNYIFECGDFRYEDQYFGEYLDVGEEIVWYQQVPIWGMAYRGGVHQAFIYKHKPAFTFLRKALSNPDINFPVRGPLLFHADNYSYKNFPEGNILSFSGREVIEQDGEEICFRNYLGGIIIGKKNWDIKADRPYENIFI